MPPLISKERTARGLTLKEAIAATDSAFKQYARGMATFQTRTDMWSPTARDGDYYRWGSLLGAINDPPALALRLASHDRSIRQSILRRWSKSPSSSTTCLPTHGQLLFIASKPPIPLPGARNVKLFVQSSC